MIPVPYGIDSKLLNASYGIGEIFIRSMLRMQLYTNFQRILFRYLRHKRCPFTVVMGMKIGLPVLIVCTLYYHLQVPLLLVIALLSFTGYVADVVVCFFSAMTESCWATPLFFVVYYRRNAQTIDGNFCMIGMKGYYTAWNLVFSFGKILCAGNPKHSEYWRTGGSSCDSRFCERETAGGRESRCAARC